jgi:hypothetical protein
LAEKREISHTGVSFFTGGTENCFFCHQKNTKIQKGVILTRPFFQLWPGKQACFTGKKSLLDPASPAKGQILLNALPNN